jgi:hypothetical protein
VEPEGGDVVERLGCLDVGTLEYGEEWMLYAWRWIVRLE